MPFACCHGLERTGILAVCRMAPRNHAREATVKALNACAGVANEPKIPENAGRQRVEALVATLQAHNGSEQWRADLDKAAADYQATWLAAESPPNAASSNEAPDESGAAPADGEDVEKHEWKFSAFQATYNSTKGEWASKDPKVQKSLFERVVAFAATLAAALKALGTTCSMEWSTSTMEHVHVHVYMHLKKAFRKKGRDALDDFAFEGIRPHLSPNKAVGKSYDGAVRYGHFYVYVDKIGSLFVDSNHRPFETPGYGVEGWWLDNMLKQGKLTRQVYLKWAARVTAGFQKRLADVRAAERFERELAVDTAVQEEADALAPGLVQPKSFPEVERFLGYFAKASRWQRRPFLVIIGGTNLGKSVLAMDVLRRVGELVGAPEALEITVEANPCLDLADFDRVRHAGVLLDGVGDALILKHNRESLQGRAKASKGGQSATNMYAYKYSFCRRAVVATLDLSAANLEQFEKDHWLSSALNVIVLRLTEPAFALRGEPSTPRTATPSCKRRWPTSPPH